MNYKKSLSEKANFFAQRTKNKNINSYRKPLLKQKGSIMKKLIMLIILGTTTTVFAHYRHLPLGSQLNYTDTSNMEYIIANNVEITSAVLAKKLTSKDNFKVSRIQLKERYSGFIMYCPTDGVITLKNQDTGEELNINFSGNACFKTPPLNEDKAEFVD